MVRVGPFFVLRLTEFHKNGKLIPETHEKECRTMLKRMIVLLLSAALLLGLIPTAFAESKPETRATAFVGYPSVFVEEDRYRISFLTNTNGMAWVEIGGVAYEDTTTGIMDWETKLHGIPVPQSVLNAAKSYTICFQPLSERPANNPAPGTKQTKTYSFNPVLPGEDPVLLCVSDQHDNNSGAVAVAKYGNFDALVFGGDYTAHISTEAIAQNFLKYSGELSKGTKPVIYPRGNHEIRGQYTHWIDEVMPTSSTNKSYYEVILGDVYGIVLDCGGSYTDNYEDIADTIDFEPYRVEQTRWLEQVYAKGTWKQYSKHVIFSHVPFITQSNFTDIFTDWTNILNRMDMSLLVSGHTHNFTMYGTTHSSIKTGSNFPAFTMTAYTKDPYVYTGAYLTLGDGEFTIQQVDSASLAVKSTHKVTNKTNGIATEPVTTFVTAEASLRAPTVAAGTGTGSVPAVSSPFSAHPTVFMVEDKYEISFLTTGTGMAWVEIGGVKYKDSTMGVMDWESRIHKITVPQSVLNRAKSYKICFQSMTERKAYTPVHGSTVSRTYPFTPAPDVPTFLFMSDQLNDNTNAMKVATYKDWDVFVCGGKYMKAANTENNRYYLLTLCGETTQGTKPTIFARGNREVRGFGAHDVVDSMGTSSTGESYYYFTTETVFGIVLDTGEFGADSLAAYGGTVRFQKYREQQAKWLRQILAEGKWKDYKTRIVICHQPFTTKEDSTMQAVFKEWTDILNEMGVTLMIAGHVNQYAYYAPNNAANLTSPNFPMLTMSDNGNGDYVYSGTYITFKGKTFYTENVQHTLKVRERKTVTNPLFTEGADLISNYDPTHDQNVLYFGFSNTPEDQQRYSENPVYGGTNYDEDGNLRTTNFVKGGGVNFDVPYSPNQAFNHEAGIVKAMVTGPYPTQSSYTGCVSRRFVFGETNDTIASVGSLKYKPANAEVVQVRFMLENLKLRSDIDTVDPAARARSVSLQYYKNDATSATRNGYNYGGTHVNGKYVTITLNLDNNFRSADVITKIWVEFHGFVKQNDSADAYVYLDYVYIGPRATMPTRDDGYLFFDFTDSAAAQYRYASEVYGGTDFDRIRNWWDNGDVAYKTVLNGNLRYISKSMNAKSWHYLGTGVGDDDSSKREYPLHYKPTADDYCEVRLALKGATSSRADGKIGLQLELFPKAGTTENAVKVAGYFDAKLAEDGYFVVHFPLGSNASYLAMGEIVRFNVLLVNLGYGDVITVDMDYIYIGSEKDMPTAHTYETVQTPPTCTENGSITYQCNICGKGTSEVLPATGHAVVIDAAVAATCTTVGKTEGSHCSVCNTALVAQQDVASLGHDYGNYVNNGETHTATCSRCNKTSTANHTYTNGTCICGAKEVLEPVLDETIKILHTLDLASDISVTFAVAQSALENYDSYYLECVLPEYSGNAKIGTSTVEVQPVVSGNYYYFTLTGITAVRMGDMVEAVLHMTKGEQDYYSKTDSYSVATYAYGMLNSSKDAKMLTLCADLLRYGAEAQAFKGYRTDALVDADMTEIHRSYLSSTESLTFTATDSYMGDLANPTITWVGKTLDLGSKVGMKFVFDAKNYSGDFSKLSMKVTYMGSNGETKSVTVTGIEAYNAANKQYSFTFYGLLASELRTIVDVAIYDGNTQLSETLRYSAESYAAKTDTTALAALTKALFAYSDSAKAYFNK